MGLFTFSASTGAELSTKEAAWCASVPRAPVIVSAALAPIYDLAEGDRRKMLMEAFQATFVTTPTFDVEFSFINSMLST